MKLWKNSFTEDLTSVKLMMKFFVKQGISGDLYL